MNTIYKYTIDIREDNNIVELPIGAKILKIGTLDTGEEINIWVLVDTRKPKEKVKFIVYGTGHAINNIDSLEYLGTVFENFPHILGHSILVWHVFKDLSFKE